MTFNIWNCQRDWDRRREMIARLIEAHRPDVVALQETRHDPRYDRGRGQGEQLAALLGYHLTTMVAHVFIPFPRVDEGLSILTREQPLGTLACRLSHSPLLRRAVDPALRGDGNRRICLGVVLCAKSRDVYCFDTHFSLNARARVRNAVETMTFVREHAGGAPAVLMGDLNADPGDPPLRYLLGGFEVDGGTGDFIDCWSAVHPGDPGYTDESWEPRRRIDYVLARNLPAPPARVELIGREPIDGLYPSDHFGILADLPL